MNIFHCLILSALLFTIGTIGVIVKKNVIAIFLCIELMLNAVNLSFVAFSKYSQSGARADFRVLCHGRGGGGSGRRTGHRHRRSTAIARPSALTMRTS